MNAIQKACAGVGFASLLACSASYAASVDYGTVMAGEGFTFQQMAGSYSDSLTFTLGEPIEFVLSFTNLALGSNSTLTVFLDGTPIVGTFGKNLTWSWGPVDFPAGAEFLVTVTGTDSVLSNPSYSVSLATAPVPEPSTWAMLGVGALAVAASIRRQQRRS
ncbi:MAG: PEP-CTERM sorting domain-containing protein [Burkholderiales bacterium]|nr:PEP-CTERM sorting domain-containing protein [Burkholderiales bacterium]